MDRLLYLLLTFIFYYYIVNNANLSSNNAEDGDDELHPKRTCTHRIFRFVKVLAVAAAFAMMIGQFVGIAFHLVNPIQYVLRVYMIGYWTELCVIQCTKSLEWEKTDDFYLSLRISGSTFEDQ